MLPYQWLDFVESTHLLQQIHVREAFPAPTVCVVRRSRLPLTPAGEYLSDLIRKIAANHARQEARQTHCDDMDATAPVP